MTLSQFEFEDLVLTIQTQGTESDFVDCKEDLLLDTEGDKASFIRDVAALANNISESYLIIGIQDKTWSETGLRDQSPLNDSDQTQSRMNQILENRLDPQLSVRYQVFVFNGKSFGVVSVLGIRAPYIIAIETMKYGGAKTRGPETYIYRGVIYVRNGDTTSIANRQGRIQEIFNTRTGQEPHIDVINDFVSLNKYVDVEDDEFGRISLASKLVEHQMERTETGWINKYSPARSWVSFVFLPTTSSCQIDTTSLVEKMQPDKRIGRLGSWFHGLPRVMLDMLLHARGNPRIFSASWSPDAREASEKYSVALEIHPGGQIHFVQTYPLFYENYDVRFFSLVNLIGFFWQTTYLARAIYSDASYEGDVLCQVNLIGTRDTRLADFAPGWRSPFDDLYPPNFRDFTQEKNISVSRSISLVNSSDGEIEQMVREIASEIGGYYGQERPRCFTYQDNAFPFREYGQNNRV